MYYAKGGCTLEEAWGRRHEQRANGRLVRGRFADRTEPSSPDLRPTTRELVVFLRESATRCAVLQYRILLDGTSKWANESLRGHPPW